MSGESVMFYERREHQTLEHKRHYSPETSVSSYYTVSVHYISPRIPMRTYRDGTVSRNNRKKVYLCQCFDVRHVKEPEKMSKAWKPDRRSNFLSPAAHLCAVTYTSTLNCNIVEFDVKQQINQIY